jgi:hypothetical protein
LQRTVSHFLSDLCAFSETLHYIKFSALQVDDELKKIKPKDPKLMTARQRAMFERKTDKEPSPGGEQLLSLPSGKLTWSF